MRDRTESHYQHTRWTSRQPARHPRPSTRRALRCRSNYRNSWTRNRGPVTVAANAGWQAGQATKAAARGDWTTSAIEALGILPPTKLGRGCLEAAEAARASRAAESAAPLFGQTTASAVFRNGPFAGRTIGDVAAALRAGHATAADLPVDVIVRNGETIGLNTRSMLALRRAGIPVKDWVINDVTGNPAMERLLTERLARNGLGGGTGLLRITGAGPNASSLR